MNQCWFDVGAMTTTNVKPTLIQCLVSSERSGVASYTDKAHSFSENYVHGLPKAGRHEAIMSDPDGGFRSAIYSEQNQDPTDG